jgi:hypothetical protein
VADAHADLAEVLLAAGKADDAAAEFHGALELYKRKGHLVGVEKMGTQLAELAGRATRPAS